MPSIIKWIIGLIVFFIFGYYYMYIHRKPHKIESIVYSRVQNNLDQAGYSNIDVEVDGQYVKLSGTAPSQEVKDKIIDMSNVSGNNPVDGVDIVVGNIDKYYFNASRKIGDESLRLTGLVPNEQIKDSIYEGALKLYSGNIINELQIDNYTGELADKFERLASASLGPLKEFNSDSSARVNIKETVYSGSYSIDQVRSDAEGIFSRIGGSDYSLVFPAVTVTTIATTLPPTTTTTLVKIDCQKKINNALAGEMILFKSNDYTVRKSSFALLKRLSDTLKVCPKWLISVEGHTDTSGLKKKNWILSRKRAKAVKRKLMKYGVNGDRIGVLGYGESRPLVKEKNKKDMAKNRRIEIKLKGEK